MKMMSIALRAAFIATAGIVTAASADAPRPYPPATVILLAAPWCAPCYQEIAQIDQIAVAARPYDVRLLLVEDGARARAMVRGVNPARLWEPPPGRIRRIRAELLSRTPGLPYAVVINERGRICAERGGSLDAARARRLVALCRP